MFKNILREDLTHKTCKNRLFFLKTFLLKRIAFSPFESWGQIWGCKASPVIPYLEENLDYESDPLKSEPTRIRKSPDSYPCCLCEYFTTTTRNLKRHVETKLKREISLFTM